MATLPTVTQFENATEDALTIGEVTLNNYTATTTTNRDGDVVRTLKGQLNLLNYSTAVAYAGGIVFTTANHRKTVIYDDITYAVIPTQLPYTLTGTWNTDKAKLFPIQFDIDELADETEDLVTLSGRPANSTTLGTFTGTVVADNLDIKDTIQDFGDTFEPVIDDHYALLSEVSVSAANSIDFDVTAYTGYTKYKLVLSNVRPNSTDAVMLYMTINDSEATNSYLSYFKSMGATSVQSGIIGDRVNALRTTITKSDRAFITVELQAIYSLLPTNYKIQTTHTSGSGVYQWGYDLQGIVDDTLVFETIEFFWQSAKEFNPTGTIRLYGSKE